MKIEPLISIIVPAYNVEKYINKCVDSIIAQTYNNLEIILVDDGSSDSTGKICDEYLKYDNRIIVIHKSNGGLSDARNAGLDIAKGEYIGFVDGDDYISINMYKSLYNRIIADKTDMAVCSFSYVNEFGEDLSNLNACNPLSNEIVQFPHFFSKLVSERYWYFAIAVNKLYSKKIWNNLRFPYAKLHEDEFVAHKVMGLCASISFLEEKNYFYVQRKGSIIQSTYNVNRLDAVEAMMDRIHYFSYLNLFRENEHNLFRTIYLLREGYRLLDKQISNNYKRFRKLKNDFSKICFKCLFGKFSINSKMHFLIFGISIKLYNTIIEKHAKNKLRRNNRCDQ